jgi:hypothetical protein
MSYVFVVDSRLEPLFKYITREDMLAFLGNDGREKVLGLFCCKTEFFMRYLCDPGAWKLIGKAMPIFGRNPPQRALHQAHPDLRQELHGTGRT